MRFGILGPTRAWRGHDEHGDGEVVIGGRALRALLALLLARPGEVVSVDTLVEDLYGDRLPREAGHALQSQISRLRRVLAGVTIDALSAGYRLSVDPDDIDLGEFERLAQEGRQALAADQLNQAAASLDVALALWRGDPLADATDAPSVRALVLRLNERRLGAIEDLLEARLGLGEHQAVIAELRELVARHPLRERPHGLLLRALAATGEPAQALAAYAQFREQLADELGAEPSAELQAIHLSLLRPPTHPSRRTAPAMLTSFIGRTEDVARVGELLTSHRLVTLYGPGGVGKTRLATEVIADRPDACFVALDALRDGVQVSAAILAALGLRDSGPHTLPASTPTARLVAALSGESALLVLDNCEHVVQAVAELAEQLLTSCPRVRVLATSREALRVPGEHLWPVQPLDPAAAVRLFADRAAAAHPGFVIDEDPVAEICRRLDGLPLAIELAAARVRTMDVAAIATGLADRFALLSRGSRTAQPRHQTLRAAVAWSWDLLTDDERVALRRLSVFAGGADLRAATAVCAVDEIIDVLDSVVDKSLLTVAGGRYRMLDTVAAYADERLAEADESTTTRQVHASYYLDLATEADPYLRGPEQLTWLGVLGAEQQNLHTALHWTVSVGDSETSLRLVAATATYFWMRGTRAVAGDLAAAALARVSDNPPSGLENEYVLCVLAASASSTGRTAYERHIPTAQAIALASPRPLHPVTTFLRSLVGAYSDPEALLSLVQRGFTSPDPWEAAAAHLVWGYPQLVWADATAAEREFVTAADGFAALGERWGRALALGSLAGLADMRGDHARAVNLAGDAVALLEELGAVEELCDLYCDRGSYRVRLAVATDGDPSIAGADFDRAAWMARRAGLPAYEASAARGLADIAFLVGDLKLARRHYEQALTYNEMLWIPGAINRVDALLGLARVDLSDGELDQARGHGWQAVELAAATGMPPQCARAVETLAEITLLFGDAARAASLLGAAGALRGPDMAAGPDADRTAHTTRLALGDERFDALYATSARLNHTAALELVGIPPEIIDEWRHRERTVSLH